MTTNCWPGDLAIVISGPNIGRLVRVCGPLYQGDLVTTKNEPDKFPFRSMHDEPYWFIEEDVIVIQHLFIDGVECANSKDICNFIADKHLRPIQNPEGEDETLSWIDVPNPIQIECIT